MPVDPALIPLQFLQRRVSGRHRRDVAVEGSRVVHPALRYQFPQFPPASQATEGKATGHCLAEGSQIGSHTEVSLRATQPEPEASDDLIKDQNDPMTAADVAHSLQVPLHGQDAARVAPRKVARAAERPVRHP